jgi:hypothetical protein
MLVFRLFLIVAAVIHSGCAAGTGEAEVANAKCSPCTQLVIPGGGVFVRVCNGPSFVLSALLLKTPLVYGVHVTRMWYPFVLRLKCVCEID